MALQNISGAGQWIPIYFQGFDTGPAFNGSNVTLDADEEEVQIIGQIQIDGAASKTFGTSGSKIGWLPSTPITFQASATLRVGVKAAVDIDTANGPAARATIGAAAFDVYDDLVGGTDTITASTWREEAMSAGTPFTVNDGQLLAVCFHLDIVSAAQSIMLRKSLGSLGLPAITLVTGGPTYTAQALMSNVILIFDDGTIGWFNPSFVSSDISFFATSSGNIGNGNTWGNIFQVPYPCKIDALGAYVAGSGDFALELYSTPLGTPSLVASVSFDANIESANARFFPGYLSSPVTLAANTDYAIGVKQTTATAVNTTVASVTDHDYWKPWYGAGEIYAAKSTAGATFAATATTLKRYNCYVRIKALDDGVSAGGGRPEFRESNL